MLYTDDYFMKQAYVEALNALDRGEIPVGCVVVLNNKIIARGYNLTEQLNDVTAHAEIQAITSAACYLGGKYLSGCNVYVTLEPCAMCAGAFYWAQISRLVYAVRDTKRGYFSQGVKLHPKTEVSSGIMEKECQELISSFFKSRR